MSDVGRIPDLTKLATFIICLPVGIYRSPNNLAWVMGEPWLARQHPPCPCPGLVSFIAVYYTVLSIVAFARAQHIRSVESSR
jgi:hypothetical protein